MKKCFLCSLEDSVNDFDNESFKKCFFKLLFRREKNFAYSEVRLSLNSIDKLGYHSSCYKKVTVLSKKYSEEYTQFFKKHDVSISYLVVYLNEQLLVLPPTTWQNHLRLNFAIFSGTGNLNKSGATKAT